LPAIEILVTLRSLCTSLYAFGWSSILDQQHWYHLEAYSYPTESQLFRQDHRGFVYTLILEKHCSISCFTLLTKPRLLLGNKWDPLPEYLSGVKDILYSSFV
jgi:hypothetical protein